MDSVKEKVQKLCEIYSLPFVLGWKKDTRTDSYTAYHYWKALELLNEDQVEEIFRDGVVRPNQLLIRFFRSMQALFPPAQYRGGEVADVGSGFGFMTFWAVLNDAAKVHTIGDPERIGFIRRLYDAAVERNMLPSGRLAYRPEFVGVGDTTLSRTIKPGTLSLVLLTDTLEHITPRRLPSLALSAYNDLRPGGIFKSKQQNTDSLSMRMKLFSVWEHWERSTGLAQRAAICRAKCPGTDDRAVEEFATRTRGLDQVDFHNALERFVQDGTVPDHRPDLPPNDVETDVPVEGDTGIARVLAEFGKAGFKKRAAYPYLLYSRRYVFFQPLARWVPSLFFKTGTWDATSVFLMKKV